MYLAWIPASAGMTVFSSSYYYTHKPTVSQALSMLRETSATPSAGMTSCESAHHLRINQPFRKCADPGHRSRIKKARDKPGLKAHLNLLTQAGGKWLF
jgi:hypothetical protein